MTRASTITVVVYIHITTGTTESTNIPIMNITTLGRRLPWLSTDAISWLDNLIQYTVIPGSQTPERFNYTQE